jgi:hypothetical protein
MALVGLVGRTMRRTASMRLRPTKDLTVTGTLQSQTPVWYCYTTGVEYRGCSRCISFRRARAQLQLLSA